MTKYPLLLSAVAALALANCSTSTGLVGNSSSDPLESPGGNLAALTAPTSQFKGGQFVRAAMDNTAFFKVRPSGSADADKLLPRGTSMKFISESDNYVKVELDSGEIGHVPAVMIEDPQAASAAVTAPTTAPGEYQIYPPLPVTGLGEPLPVIDPNGLPPESAIPTVIDPAAPSTPPAPAAPNP
jgi:hypothetical protein